MVFRLASCVLLSGAMIGCGGAATQQFRPGAKERATRAEGAEEAQYALRGPGGVFGEAKVWSRGAVASALDGAPVTGLHVGFELNNTGANALLLDRADIRLAVVRTDEGVLTGVAPKSGHGVRVEPQSLGEAQFFFALPQEVKPRDIRAFQLRWAVRTGDPGRPAAYMQRTPFVERKRRQASHQHYGFYDIYHPSYWYYRNLGYCYDPLCRHVIFVPVQERPGQRLRVRVRP